MLGWLSGCGSSSGTGSDGNGGSSASSGAGGAAGGAAAGGAGGFGGLDGGTGGNDCGGMLVQGERLPIGVYIMFDDSGSMATFWRRVVEGTRIFLNDPDSAGMWVGIQFFGPEEPAGCDVNRYSTPAVDLAPLPGNAAAVGSAFPEIPINETPTEPALEGAIVHARDFATQQQMNTVVLLVTDGEPQACNSTLQGVTQIAADGLAGSPSIRTFVVGLSFSLDNLDAIATAGGTGDAILVDPFDQGAVADALNAVRGTVVPCDYEVPPEALVDLSLVNVEFTPPNGSTETVPQSDETCPEGMGWYYDDPVSPTRIITCPDTCTALRQGGSVNVRVGCPTVMVR